MDLHTQIITLFFSLGYGFFFTMILDIFHKPFCRWGRIGQVIFSFLYVISTSLLYFFILLKLNNAILHPYYLLLFLVGFLLEIVFKRLGKRIVFLLKK